MKTLAVVLLVISLFWVSDANSMLFPSMEDSGPDECGQYEEYKECRTANQPTCENPYPRKRPQTCIPGCDCIPGFVRNQLDQCVPLHMCQNTMRPPFFPPTMPYYFGPRFVKPYSIFRQPPMMEPQMFPEFTPNFSPVLQRTPLYPIFDPTARVRNYKWNSACEVARLPLNQNS